MAKVVKRFYQHTSKADLLAYPLAPSYAETPNWYHWDKVAMITPKKQYWMATYNQFSRVSRRVLEAMHKLSVERKRLFFHEGMFATLCQINGYGVQYLDELRILDLFIHIRWNKPYTPEEVSKLIKEHKHVLLHPVKWNL
jgi:hypothetical protein